MEIWLWASTLVALLFFVAWTIGHPRARLASRGDELRVDAAWIRREHPDVYLTILEQPGGRAAAASGHAEEYVASWLGEFDKSAR